MPPDLTRRQFLAGSFAVLVAHHRPDHHRGKPQPTQPPSVASSGSAWLTGEPGRAIPGAFYVGGAA